MVRHEQSALITDHTLHSLGADGGNMIAQAAVGMEFGAAADNIARNRPSPPQPDEAMSAAGARLGDAM